MTNFRLISRLAALSSLLSMLFVFRSRVERPSWPPPEDMYWGM
jgi:hypothetical protein